MREEPLLPPPQPSPASSPPDKCFHYFLRSWELESWDWRWSWSSLVTGAVVMRRMLSPGLCCSVVEIFLVNVEVFWWQSQDESHYIVSSYQITVKKEETLITDHVSTGLRVTDQDCLDSWHGLRYHWSRCGQLTMVMCSPRSVLDLVVSAPPSSSSSASSAGSGTRFWPGI